MNRRTSALVALIAGSMLVSACGKEKPLYVDQAWVRLNAAPGAPAAGYFTVHGGANDVVLRTVRTDAAVRLEMHDSVMRDGVMTMNKISDVPVKAGEKLSFAPGGKHLMIWQINPTVVQSGKMTLRFLFSNGDEILVDAPIQQPGDAAPVADNAAKQGHEGH